jgi:TolB-like protein/Flp pilus assembly protein TadD
MYPAFHGAVRFGGFELDTEAGELRKGKKRLHLPPQPLKVLCLLVNRAGQLVTRDELRQQLWHTDTFVDFEQGLNVCVRQIREVLSDSADAPRFVETVPRRGYRFIAHQVRVPLQRSIHSLAILPFENSSGDPDLEYLGDGIAESLINSLSAIESLRVVPRAVAFRCKGRNDLEAVGRELNISAVVTGRIVSQDRRINVQAELVDLASESQLWGEHYHAQGADVFEAQDKISREICDHLRLHLTAADTHRLKKRYTHNPDAYHLYLKGRFCFERRTQLGLRKAIEYFEQAIEKDWNYALAYAGLGDCYTLLGCGTYGALPAKSATSRASAMALQAVAADDTLAEAHTSLAFVRFRFEWDWSEAEKEFQRAIELNPRYARAHHWYALFLAAMDRHNNALDAIKRAQELEPLSLPATTAEGRILHFARRYDEAIERFQNVLDLDPNFIPAHFDLGASYQQKHMYKEALNQYQTCAALSGGSLIYVAAMAEAYARLGKRAEAFKILGEIRAASAKQYLAPNDVALIYTALGLQDEAFSCLEKAFEHRDASLAWSKVAPECDPLRSDPRFKNLLRRMKLTA